MAKWPSSLSQLKSWSSTPWCKLKQNDDHSIAIIRIYFGKTQSHSSRCAALHTYV
jgi:hypothetical protein